MAHNPDHVTYVGCLYLDLETRAGMNPCCMEDNAICIYNHTITWRLIYTHNNRGAGWGGPEFGIQ